MGFWSRLNRPSKRTHYFCSYWSFCAFYPLKFNLFCSTGLQMWKILKYLYLKVQIIEIKSNLMIWPDYVCMTYHCNKTNLAREWLVCWLWMELRVCFNWKKKIIWLIFKLLRHSIGFHLLVLTFKYGSL